jgi:NADH-quinone oxidoreductase subunit L
MMMGLGVGGVFVGMFHLLTHAFFKALLFLGAGSVIHGCHEEQDITKMGGLRRQMPVTFATYAIGMMALAGVPLLFSGFWSKDEILHAASHWHASKIPFLLGLFGAFLTAFYMTRQMILIFFGTSRSAHKAHESPPVMTTPLIVLAVFAVLLGFIATPIWPWLHTYLTGHEQHVSIAQFLLLAFLSTLVVGSGIAGGWYLYARMAKDESRDPLEVAIPGLFQLLRNRFWVDEAYDTTVLRINRWLSLSVAKMESGFFALLGGTGRSGIRLVEPRGR